MSYLYFIVILNLILRCAGFRKSCSTCPKGFFFWRVFSSILFYLSTIKSQQQLPEEDPIIILQRKPQQ